MFSGTIENGRITERDMGHEGHRTWDVWHCHPHMSEYPVGGGVKRSSTIHVYVLEPIQPSGQPYPAAIVGAWVPGGLHLDGAADVTPDGQQLTLPWGQELWFPVTAWGSCSSVVSFNDVPLHVVWESAPGKA